MHIPRFVVVDTERRIRALPSPERRQLLSSFTIYPARYVDPFENDDPPQEESSSFSRQDLAYPADSQDSSARDEGGMFSHESISDDLGIPSSQDGALVTSTTVNLAGPAATGKYPGGATIVQSGGVFMPSSLDVATLAPMDHADLLDELGGVKLISVDLDSAVPLDDGSFAVPAMVRVTAAALAALKAPRSILTRKQQGPKEQPKA